MRHLILLPILFTSACRPEKPLKPVEYLDPSGLFACLQPVGWTVSGPRGGAHRATFTATATIAVYFYNGPEARFRHPREYAYMASAAATRTDGLVERTWRVRNALEMSLERPGPDGPLFEHIVFPFSHRGGFYALVHSAPASFSDESTVAFKDFLDSFRELP